MTCPNCDQLRAALEDADDAILTLQFAVDKLSDELKRMRKHSDMQKLLLDVADQVLERYRAEESFRRVFGDWRE